MTGPLDTKGLVEKIAELVRARIVSGPVVSLEDFKDLELQTIPKTLLIIEDDDVVRRSLERIFQIDGYRVLIAKDAVELRDVLIDVQVDLVMLDIGLPWINGFELAELMKAHVDLKRVPLIFISGHQDMDIIKKGFSVGADDYITKPFEIENVRKTVNTLLELNS